MGGRGVSEAKKSNFFFLQNISNFLLFFKFFFPRATPGPLASNFINKDIQFTYPTVITRHKTNLSFIFVSLKMPNEYFM